MANKETILVVEDNKQISDLVARQMLPSMGYEALAASSGKKAIELITSNRLALILLDQQLPDMSGLDILRQLSTQGHSVPAILMTAHGSEQVAADAFRLGVQDYLTKPVEFDILQAAINRALTNTRLQQEKAKLTKQLQDQVTWLTVLSKVGRSVTSTLDLDEVLRRIVEAGVHLTQAEEGFLALLDETNGQLFLRAAKNIDQDKANTFHIPATDSIMEKVIATGRPWRSSQDRSHHAWKVTTGYLVKSLIYVPLLSKNKVLGVLSVDNQLSQRVFKQNDENLLTSLADYAAIALENANLYENAQVEIATRKRIEEALRESEERYILAVRGANDGIWDWNLRTNQIYYSPRWKMMLGYQDDEIGDTWEEWFDRIHPEDAERVKLDISAHIKEMTPHFSNEHRLMHKDGIYRWMLSRGVAVRDGQGVACRLAGSLTDITDRKYAEDKLLHDAFFDTLTNLPNRALFIDRLRLAVERNKRKKDYRFAVLFLDLDRFKDVNDSMGHLIGDQLLVAIGEVLRKGFRSTDTVSRFGGDEFVVLLEDLREHRDAIRIAEWIQNKLSQPFSLGEREVFITASVGIVLSSTGYERPEDVLRDADIAMYTAKANGRARYEIFTSAMRTRLMDRIVLESELRRALERGEFRIHYQPIISLESGELTGFEALIRWMHSTHGMLTPAYFLPVAEETNLILQIDRWVLKEACRQMHTWQERRKSANPLTISVNFSGKQVSQPDLVEFIENTLKETELEPSCLKIEMTENTIMKNNEENVAVFSRLQALGVQVQIDDFGIGYSSLSYLSHFPVNALKIDQTFVRNMTEDNNHLKIVQAIVMLTERLGVGVIAEGVESDRQLVQLKALGCRYGQGYHISSPLEPGKVEDLFEALNQDPNMLHLTSRSKR